MTKQNLIEWKEEILEQQKETGGEIEELKDITRAYDGMKGIMPEGHPIVIADKEYFDSGRFTEKYISKDKIRREIKELELRKSFSDDFTEEFYLTQIDLLKELLEENKKG